MNKKVLLFSFTAVSAVAVGLSFLATVNNKQPISPMTADAIHPGTIVIDVNNPDLDVSAGTATFHSAAGNEFSFEMHGFVKEDGLLKMPSGATFGNQTILNGITELKFLTPNYEQHVRIGWAIDSSDKYDNDKFIIGQGEYSVTFPNYDPSFFFMETENDEEFAFSRLTIYYECVADVPTYSIDYIGNNGQIEGYQINANDVLFAPTASSLSSITLADCYIMPISGYGFNINDKTITDLSIIYEDSDSTLVLEHNNSARLSFKCNGAIYNSDKIIIVGYDHIDFEANHFSLSDTNFLQQESDTIIPEDFYLNVNGQIQFYDSSSVNFDHFNASLSRVSITESMIIQSDEHRFSELGEHSIKLSYNGVDNVQYYTIYNPEINNIRNVYIPYSLKVPVGSSLEDFITYISEFAAQIQYFDYDKAKEQGLPNQVYLGEDNFDLTAGMFDSGLLVIVPVRYSTYSGTIMVEIEYQKGNPHKVYNNEDGVLIMGDLIHVITTYDNFTCEIGTGDDLMVFPYTLDGTTMTIMTEYGNLRFTLDDENNTFTKYNSTEGLIMTVHTDFTVLGAPSILYDGLIYNNGTIVFDIEGMEMACDIEYDPLDSNIIYFDFNMGDIVHCKGTIDPSTLVMVVSIVS